MRQKPHFFSPWARVVAGLYLFLLSLGVAWIILKAIHG
jgi:hypothetical protein